MPNSKNSFIVYHDQAEIFNELSDEDAGKLIKSMIQYSRGDELSQLPQSLRLVFIPIRQQLDRNKENYERVSQINSGNAKKRWESVQKDTKSSETMRPHANAYDTDKDKDTDKDIKYQQADSNFTGNLLGMEIKAPKTSTKWQIMAVDYAGKLGITPTASWFKFFKNGDEGKLQDTYAKMFGLAPTDPEKYFYKIYGGNYAPDTTK